MQFSSVFIVFLLPLVFGGVIQKETSVEPVKCKTVPVTECPVTCGGSWRQFKLVCVDEMANCPCGDRPVFKMCSNWKCLGPNATPMELFEQAEAQQEEENDIEYYEGDSDETTSSP